MVFAVLSKKYCTATISWTHRRTDRASKQEPCPLGTRPAPSALVCFAFFSFPFLCIFLSSPYSCFSFSFSSLFGRTSTYHGFVPGIIWMQVIRDGIPQLVSIVLFAYSWYYIGAPTSYILVCFSPIKNVSACFCDHGPDFREIELM